MNTEDNYQNPLRVDHDIEDLLTNVAQRRHTIQEATERFLDSLPGHDNLYHLPLTIKTYRQCLLGDPNNFKDFMGREGIYFIDGLAKDKLMFYKTFLCGKMDPQTAKKYTTAVRQLLKFCESIEWLHENLWKDFHLPKKPKRSEIQIIPPEVVQEVLACNWGKNPFIISRNKLIINLLLRRGLHPKEFPPIFMTDIHPYQDLAFLHVFGKRNVPRDVMLDEESFLSLKDYGIKRAYYLDWRRIHDNHLLLSLIP